VLNSELQAKRGLTPKMVASLTTTCTAAAAVLQPALKSPRSLCAAFVAALLAHSRWQQYCGASCTQANPAGCVGGICESVLSAAGACYAQLQAASLNGCAGFPVFNTAGQQAQQRQRLLNLPPCKQAGLMR